jgi:hypothetical protein
MKIQELNTKLAPFGQLVNRHALSVNYRALHLAPNFIRGCSMFGTMETEFPTGLTEEVFVDGDAFIQLCRSLRGEEIELRTASGVLYWTTGKQAKGQVAALGEKVAIPAPVWPADLKMHEVTADFGRALDLGGIACGSTALLSLGLFGVHVENAQPGVMAYASDNSTMSTARLGDQIPDSPEAFVLSPEACGLVTTLAAHGRFSFCFDDTTVYGQTPDTRLMVKQVPPLKVPLRGQVDKYLGDEIKLDLDRETIAAFIRRSEALAEERGKAAVSLSVEGGQVKLSFAEGRSSSEEYCLASGSPEVSVDAIVIDARRLGRALQHSAHIVFDYADQGALVLRGERGFAFVIAERAAQ